MRYEGVERVIERARARERAERNEWLSSLVEQTTDDCTSLFRKIKGLNVEERMKSESLLQC